MISIVTNSLNTKIQQCITSADKRVAATIQNLSTGLKVNSAKDDSAGLYAGTNFSVQTSGTKQAYNNTLTGINILGTADNALGNMSNLISRVRELALRSANGTYSSQERSSMQQEAEGLVAEMRNIEKSTSFSGRSIFAETGGISGNNTPAENNPNHKTVEQVEAEYASAKASGNLVLINTRAELEAIKNTQTESNKVYVLMSDINLAGKEWEPISPGYATAFKGTIDGNGYKIDNLTCSSGSYKGFIGDLMGTVKNLALTNVNISGGSTLGGLVGRFDSGTIDNCYVTGKVSGTGNQIGGITGRMLASARIINSYANVDVSGGQDTGGLVGALHGNVPRIENCYSEGTVSGATPTSSNIGGLIGSINATTPTLVNSYSTSRVLATSSSSGGFIGNITSSNISAISNNHWSSESSGKSTSVGTGFTLDDTRAKNEKASFFSNSKNLTFLGGNYDYDFNPPQLKLFVEPPPNPPKGMRLQVGANSGDDNVLYIDCSFTLGDFKVNLATATAALDSLNKIDALIKKISNKRSGFGAYENRLNSALSLQLTRELNYSSSESAIMDTDIAASSSKLTKSQILRNAGVSLLSQTSQINKDLLLSLI
ncbi:MAG: flagellin [Candidatus Gastranaerophilales bacterium]|nr:flagellin [Candidatus Gastranaerophilales bacterium]